MLGLQRAQAARLPPLDRFNAGRSRSAAVNGRAGDRSWWCAGTRRRMETATRKKCRRKQCGRTRGCAGRRGLHRTARGRRRRGRFAAVHSRDAGRSGRSARPRRRGRTGTCRSRTCRWCGRTWIPTCGRSRRRLSGRSSGRRGDQYRQRRRCQEGREAWLRCFGLAQSYTGQQQGVSGGMNMNSASDQ